MWVGSVWRISKGFKLQIFNCVGNCDGGTEQECVQKLLALAFENGKLSAGQVYLHYAFDQFEDDYDDEDMQDKYYWKSLADLSDDERKVISINTANLTFEKLKELCTWCGNSYFDCPSSPGPGWGITLNQVPPT